MPTTEELLNKGAVAAELLNANGAQVIGQNIEGNDTVNILATIQINGQSEMDLDLTQNNLKAILQPQGFRLIMADSSDDQVVSLTFRSRG